MLGGLTKSTVTAVRVGAMCLVLAGCTTAELAIDLVKKSQKEKVTVKQAEELLPRGREFPRILRSWSPSVLATSLSRWSSW